MNNSYPFFFPIGVEAHASVLPMEAQWAAETQYDFLKNSNPARINPDHCLSFGFEEIQINSSKVQKGCRVAPSAVPVTMKERNSAPADRV